MERAISQDGGGAVSIWDMPLKERVTYQIRRRLVGRAYVEADPKRRQAALERSAKDPIWWVNHWVWTYDPRIKVDGVPRVIPFDLYPRQVELLNFIQDCIANDEAPVVDKSRGVGGSYLILALALWYWLFRRDITIGLGSRTKPMCDSLDNPMSMFWKIRHMIQRLPRWMRPRAYRDKEYHLINHDTGSKIIGEGGKNMGRCGRVTWYLLDEASAVEQAHIVEAALSGVGPTVIWLGTPPLTGMTHQFSKRRWCGEYPVFSFHWSENPTLDNDWYQNEKRKYEKTNAAIVPVELDLDYDTGGGHEVLIPSKWVRAAVGLDLPMSGTRGAGFDVSGQGKNKHVYAFRAGPCLRWAQDIDARDAVQAAYIAADYAERDRTDVLSYDEIGVGEGARGAYNARDSERYTHTAQGVNAGSKPSDTYFDKDKRGTDLFLNKRAELGWALRTRFYKTWQHMEGIRTYSLDELISIPNDPNIISQMSVYRYYHKVGGKIFIESKEQLRARGIASPDYYEATALAFAGDVGQSSTAWLERLLS